MKEGTIKILVRRAGQEPTVETIRNHFTAMQEIVGGTIQMPYNPDLKDVQMVCNDEGKFLEDAQPNVRWGDYDVIFGDIFFVGTNKAGGSVSLTEAQIAKARKFIADNDASDYAGDPQALADALFSVTAFDNGDDFIEALFGKDQNSNNSAM
jgi:hypothetical protein